MLRTTWKSYVFVVAASIFALYAARPAYAGGEPWAMWKMREYTTVVGVDQVGDLRGVHAYWEWDIDPEVCGGQTLDHAVVVLGDKVSQEGRDAYIAVSVRRENEGTVQSPVYKDGVVLICNACSDEQDLLAEGYSGNVRVQIQYDVNNQYWYVFLNRQLVWYGSRANVNMGVGRILEAGGMGTDWENEVGVLAHGDMQVWKTSTSAIGGYFPTNTATQRAHWSTNDIFLGFHPNSQNAHGIGEIVEIMSNGGECSS